MFGSGARCETAETFEAGVAVPQAHLCRESEGRPVFDDCPGQTLLAAEAGRATGRIAGARHRPPADSTQTWENVILYRGRRFGVLFSL